MKFTPSSIIRLVLETSFFLLPVGFYLYTCAPSIGLGDTALLIDGIKNLKINTHVNNHNLTVLVGWLFQFFPFGDIAYRANLSSVFLGALTVFSFYFLIWNITASRISAAISALFLMVSHSMWWHSTISEVYALNALLTVAALHLYWRLKKTGGIRFLYALFFLSGLAVFNHVQMGCLAIGAGAALLYIIYKSPRTAPALFFRAVLFFLIGFLPYLATFIHDLETAGSFKAALSYAFGGDFKNLMFKGTFWNGIKDYLFLVFMQFPSPFLIAIIPGTVIFFKKWGKSPSGIGIFATFAVVTWFFMFYNTWDKFAFLLPSFIVLMFWSSFAVDALRRHSRIGSSGFIGAHLLALVALSLGLNIYFYSHLSRWGSKPESMWYKRFNNNHTYNLYRVNEYIANPNKRDFHDISELCDLIFEKLPRNSKLIDDDSRSYHTLALYYQRFYRKRLDLNIRMINSWGFKNWGASQDTFAEQVRNAYLKNEDFFLISLGGPFDTFLAKIPDRNLYRFDEYRLDDKRWIYKLATAKDRHAGDDSRKGKWDVLNSSGEILIDLTLDNVLTYSDGTPLFQENMGMFGAHWKNNDQVFFGASEKGAEIGFLLKFTEPARKTLSLGLTTANDYGIVEIHLNDTLLTPEPADLYSENVNFKKLELGTVSFDKGNNILLFRIIGNNSRSEGLKIGIDTIEIGQADFPPDAK